jgi:predicted nucleic acid-binding protein
MIVVDTNTIAYLLIAGERSDQARAVLRKDPEWVAPRLWRSEFRNILTLYLRQKLLNLNQSLQFMQEAELLMEGGEYEVPSSRVLSLASTSSCSAYDCEFVALAQDLGKPLITSDRKLLKEFSTETQSMDSFIS